MFTERTSVGLDVHARSVAAAAIDGATGELVQARLTPDHGHIRSWIQDLPGPVAVTYEAGPTGFDLARVSRDGFSGGLIVPLRRSPGRCGDDSRRPRTRPGARARSLRAGAGN